MKYKLVCFDVDGTLIDNLTFSWQLFHDHFQTDEHKRDDAKRKFYNKEISYREWAEHDIQLWKDRNATKQGFFDAIDNGKLRLMEGAMETLLELKKRKLKLAIISGSLNIILEKFIPDCNDIFDDVFLSRIYFDEKGSISKVEATEYDMEGKALAMRKIAERENIRLGECAFVGDYLNDRKIMEEAGLGIAFNCRHDELKKVADVVIEKKDLREILRHII
ncbi:HAD family phosphatase [Candidatus Woesearchaeota archaeon]|nr:HAD family phosphatase [Candidatus Woesearchaeota archaeon]MBI2660941.1 HAD family phosphatase [Candidatus Woesearchaeota archaeon]